MRTNGQFAFGESTPPEREEFLSLGPPSDRLYKQGKCGVCKIPLFGLKPKKRAYCGLCLKHTRDETAKKYASSAATPDAPALFPMEGGE